MFTTALCLLCCFLTILSRILSLFSPRMKTRKNLHIINCRTAHASSCIHLMSYHCFWIRLPPFLMICLGLLICGVTIDWFYVNTVTEYCNSFCPVTIPFCLIILVLKTNLVEDQANTYWKVHKNLACGPQGCLWQYDTEAPCAKLFIKLQDIWFLEENYSLFRKF